MIHQDHHTGIKTGFTRPFVLIKHVIDTNLSASVELCDLSLQHSTVVTPVMITATRDMTPNAIPKPENKHARTLCMLLRNADVLHARMDSTWLSMGNL